MKKFHSIIIPVFALFCVSVSTGCLENETNGFVDRQYQLTWEDNFDGPAGQSPDASKWTYDLGRGPGNDGWGNAELQTYTDKPENVSLDGEGNLAIVARLEGTFTSARIKTKDLFDQAYGRFEARIKTPYGPGMWPAFWLLGNDIDEVAWPQCGEIDVMELRGQEPNVIAGTIHGPGYSGGAAIPTYFGLEDSRFDVEFHVFAVEWGEDYIDYFVDDRLYGRVTPEDLPDGSEWVYDHPFFMLLNVAVGGNYVGFPTAQTVFPQTMLVDYVRVYREVGQ